MTPHPTIESPEERRAVVHFESWAGRTRARVTVVGETPKRYRVRLDEDMSGNFGGRSGSIRLVPKYAVAFESTIESPEER